MNNQSRNNKIKPIFLFFLFSLFSFILIFSDSGFNYDFTILSINFLICVLSLYFIFLKKRYSFSQYQIIILFFLFFFGIAPAMQFKSDVVFWGAVKIITKQDYLLGNFFMLLSLILYNTFYYFDHKKRNKEKKNVKKTESKHIDLNNFLLISISFVALTIFLYSKNFNIGSVFLRSSFNSSESSAISNGSISLIINNFVRPMPAVILFSYKFFSKSKKFTFSEFILLVFVLICDFPLGMPRFLAATLYIPLLLVYSKKVRKSNNFALLFCLGLLIVFPFLDQFRFAEEISSESTNELTVNTEMFAEGTFDSYQNTIKILSDSEITYGRQLLGVLFFYVPRSIWSDKPIGSGAYIAKINKYEFSNISMSYLGEGYLNFGYLGTVLFIFILAKFTSSFDYLHWNNLQEKHYTKILYFYLFGLLFFIMRGDLLSSFAYTVGVTCAIMFILKFSKKRYK